MTKKFDFLNDVAVIELVNQISVSKDKASVLKGNNTFKSRVINFFNGANEEHQNDFNIEVSSALESIKNEILSTNKTVLKNTYSIKKLASVMIENKQELSLLDEDVSALRNQVSALESRLQKVEAKQAVDSVVEEWKVHCNIGNSPLFESIHLIQMLYWSDFTESALISNDVLKYGYNRCWNAIHEKFKISQGDFIRQVHLATQFDSLPKEERDALELMLPQVKSTLSIGYQEHKFDELLQKAKLSRAVTAKVLVRDLFQGSFKEMV